MDSRRPFWHIPTSLALGLLELLHGIPQARADILRAQAEQRWLACLRGYLDLLDRLHVTVPHQRQIIVQVMLTPARKRRLRREALETGILLALESPRKLFHSGTCAKQARAASLCPFKRKIS